MMPAPTKVVAIALLVTGLTLVLAAPQGGAAGGHDVNVVARQFDPRELTVEVGEEVTWTNKDPGHVHSVTADDGSFDSSPECSDATPGKCLDDRQQFTHIFTTEGRFPYHSRTHGAPGGQGTSGVVVVVPVGTPAPEQPAPASTSSTTASSSTTTTTSAP
jgi:plastocyanin